MTAPRLDRDEARRIAVRAQLLDQPAATRRWGTSRCRCCPATGWSGRSTHWPTAGAGCSWHAVHEDVPFTPATADGVAAELSALADWLGLPLRR